MRISTELVVEGTNYAELIKLATEHWRVLTGEDSLDLPSDTEIKVRNDGEKYTGYVTIRSKVEG